MKIILKILKFFLSNELEVAPGVFFLGGVLYENRNPPSSMEPPLKYRLTRSK
jgi:hypothetical protein